MSKIAQTLEAIRRDSGLFVLLFFAHYTHFMATNGHFVRDLHQNYGHGFKNIFSPHHI